MAAATANLPRPAVVPHGRKAISAATCPKSANSPLLEPGEEFMLAKRWREHDDSKAAPQAGDQPIQARGQDRHGLSRLRAAGGRAESPRATSA